MTFLGSTRLDALPLALGGNTFGWTSDEPTSFAVLDAFLDAGGTLVDTADGYSHWVPGNEGGESETVIGAWFSTRGRRDDVLLATKVSSHPAYRGLSAANVVAAADASLRRLRTDHIDLYYAHFDDSETPLEETVAAFAALVDQGKVRQVGLSNYSPERIDKWISVAGGLGVAAPVALQPHYNLLHRAEYESGYAPLAEKHQLAVFPYFGLAAGLLTGKYADRDAIADADRERQVTRYLRAGTFDVVGELVAVAEQVGAEPAAVALAWLRSRPGVAAPLASARVVEQLGALLTSATLNLPAEALERLDRASTPVTETL
ncbi:aldo/keto reductase [Prauserella cavernicola]|uniref:Aldo/keto reductase n=1 Tax=Prauserella cavernicola TaxID=2800127 RepID=A0A934R1J4_9PSEU|nr:aldo/keto reductase [Prauserella cavernicola]MBK1789179.1 aldo/keto reductase [Prauserella cavernicola]